MGFIDLGGRFGRLAMVAASAAAIAACHGSGDYEPLTEQKIYASDKFFDVAAVGPKTAHVIGYGGKIITTEDGGFSWTIGDVGTHKSLYSIDFAPDNRTGYIVGEEGLIFRTEDGGKSWNQQKTELWLDTECADPAEREFREDPDSGQVPCQYGYLFAVSVVDGNNIHIVGDKSIYTKSTDGGKTWTTQTIKIEGQDISADIMLAFEDPVLYDVEFLDKDNGYIVGEFGKIYHTTDGGQSWTEQQASIMDESVIDILDLPTFFDIEFSDANNGVVAGLDGRIGVTSDGGKDWNFSPNNVEEYIDPFYSAAILPSGERWVVGASGQIVHSGPGAAFGPGDIGMTVNNWLRRIRFFDEKHGWLVGGLGFIMSTEDGGKTWYRRLG